MAALLDDDHIISRLKRCLQFETVSFEGAKSGAYSECVAWLQEAATSLGLESRRLEFVKNKPILLVSYPGSDPTLPSILLNSHYDVVPAVESMWHTKPFEAAERDGNIYARGTQDMKSVCMQYLEALGRLKSNGVVMKRSVYATFVPDEEIGGVDGVGRFIQDAAFKELNVGMALDEGLASESDVFTVFYGERAMWWLKIRSVGPTGHASRFVPNVATAKLVKCITQFLNFRAEQEALLDEHGCKHATAKRLGDVVTLNLTMLRSGVTSDGGVTYALNVIPMEAEAGFDIRIPPSVSLAAMEEKLKEWTSEEGVSYEFVRYNGDHATTSIDPETNPWWKTFLATAASHGLKLDPAIFPAATDSRYLRLLGVPCFGFSPIVNTPVLLHDHNEFIGRDTYLRGISTYCTLIPAFANQ